MPYLEQVPIDEAQGEVREAYDQDLARNGYMSNYTQTFSLRPDVYAVWKTLISTIRDDMDLRRYELATVAAAAARAFFSKTLDAASARPDEAYASTTPLLDLLPAPRTP